MVNYLINIGITILITVAATFGIQNYVPLNWIDIFQPQKFGTTLVTIQGSDTISGSRTTINDNFTALNNGKIEISTTTLPLLTTLNGLTSASSLASVGTITTGVWSGTALTVSKGGTGTTSPSLYQVMLGNTTSGFTTPVGWGTSGQFLTSAGAGALPAWTTSSVDLGIPYTWTGSHTFSTSTVYNLNVGTLFATTSTTTVSSLKLKGTGIEFSDGTIQKSVYNQYVASNELQVSADTATTTGPGGVYRKLKEIQIRIPGTYRVSFDLSGDTGGYNYHGKIYRNDLPVGTEQTINGGVGYQTFTEDITNFITLASTTDLIQLYCLSDNLLVYCCNFRIYGTLSATTSFPININN